MKINLLPGATGLQVEEPSVLSALEVHISRDVKETEVAQLLADRGRSTVDHVWLANSELRRIAAGAMLTEWLGRYETMINGARTAGFVDDADMIRMHIVQD